MGLNFIATLAGNPPSWPIPAIQPSTRGRLYFFPRYLNHFQEPVHSNSGARNPAWALMGKTPIAPISAKWVEDLSSVKAEKKIARIILHFHGLKKHAAALPSRS